MKSTFRLCAAVAAIALSAQALASVTFYEGRDFSGNSFTTDKPVRDFENIGFNDRASSVVVRDGAWEVCDDARFEGHCVVLRPGTYPSLGSMGLNNRVSSVRLARDYQYGFYSPSGYDFRKRHNERIFEVPVTSVHAVVGPPERQCWVEQEQVATGSSSINVPGAIIGGVLGGILGHQIGGGRGQDVATGAGAVGGAAVGASVGRHKPAYTTQNVQRCATAPVSSHPDHWDVTYNFRGIEHRVQMSAPPGATILVNGKGEPRV
ncbi:MAG: glycine zipper 2TM domain-containing protein [Burkholderiales bacterium]|nr:glycine zipper 2TM domain-containing protein [Burkholderiales bacterium]